MSRAHQPIDKLIQPIQRFILRQRSGGVVLFISVVVALALANSPWAELYFDFFKQTLGFVFNGSACLEFDLHYWINDGLMAMFFFIVGLGLKREFIGGELANPRKAILPIAAAVGGMLVPAVIYLIFNPSGEVHRGWGIPMATDIAFAIGILYLLGDRVPASLKVFLIALAIIDDLGAVLVIAFFYTSEISVISLSIGLGFVLVMFLANKLGVRNIIFYAVVGIGGVWIAFLLSGIHATIAAVLAAFMIPADAVFEKDTYTQRILLRLKHLGRITVAPTPPLKESHVRVLEGIKADTAAAIPPLQRLEYAMGPFVTFVVLPIFALANAGVSFKGMNADMLLNTNIASGVFLGLVTGKVIGIVGVSMLFVKLGVAVFPQGMNFRRLLGLGFLASIGFTMSLFITSLAFTHPEYEVQAKIGIFTASLTGGIIGYMILNRSGKPDRIPANRKSRRRSGKSIV